MAATSAPSVQEAIANLHPASFAMAMATGIVSIAAELQGYTLLASGLLWLNVVIYAVLWLLILVRLGWYRQSVYADLFDHNRCVGFFTLVAGTCVLGNQWVVVSYHPQVAILLWYFGIFLWALTTYTIFTVLTIKKEKPDLAQGLNGGWLVAVVAAQSVSVLGTLVAPEFDTSREGVLFFSLAMWLGGGMLYLWIIALIFYRYTFMPLDARQLAPPYWINMGAMAISTLAGAVLIASADDSPLLTQLLPFVTGLTLLCWATATWWIPLLVLLGIWRHLIRRIPLSYDVVYWSMVFPLGMYTACTHRLADTVNLTFLAPVPRVFLPITVAAWTVMFLGLVFRLGQFLLNSRVRPAGDSLG